MITPIFNLNLVPAKPQINTQPRVSLALKPQLNADVVSFGNKKRDFMSKSDKEIIASVKRAIKDADILGEGGEAVVYKIGDSGYCVRKIYYNSDIDSSLQKDKLSRNVSAQDKCNHVVGRIGKWLTIMPILPGVPVNSVRMTKDEICKVASDIEKLPQSAFNSLLKQISNAYKNDMMWDCNWANLLVDTKGENLTAIDFYRNDEDEAASHLAYMFAALTHEYTTEHQCKVYAQKIMDAGLEEFKPGVTPCCRFDHFGFRDFIRCIDDLDLFKNKKYIGLLLRLTNDIRNLKACEARRQDVTNELNGKIKTVQAIMRQLVNS